MGPLKAATASSELNTPEQDVEAFRQVCLSERDEQLDFFNARFVKALGKDGLRETIRVSKEFAQKAGTKKELPIVSTEFSEFMKMQAVEFASMKQRKEAFKDLDIDGNAHISLIEVLIYMNKEMVMKASEDRWGTAPAATGPEYTSAVLREIFLPAQGYEPNFDKAIVSYCTNLVDAEKRLKDLEASKEGLSGVKARNVDLDIKKVSDEIVQLKKDFDRDLPKMEKIFAKSKKELEGLKSALSNEDEEAEKPKGGVKKGAFEGK